MAPEYSKDGGIHVCLSPMAVAGGKGGNQMSALSETQEVVGPRPSSLFVPSQTFSS